MVHLESFVVLVLKHKNTNKNIQKIHAFVKVQK